MSERTRRFAERLPAVSEITVVTIVIAIMASAMIPIVVRAHQDNIQQAQSRTCLSNMKQLSLGMLQYAQDYDSTLPASYKGAPQTWAGRLYPYIQSTSILQCPVDVTQPDTSVTPPVEVISYGLNSNLQAALQNGKPTSSGIPLKQINVPAGTVTFFEISGDVVQVHGITEGTVNYSKAPPSGMVSASGDGIGDGPEWGWLGKGPSPIKYDIGRHNGGGNYAAADGHCVWMLPTGVSSGRNNPKATGAQDDPPGSAAGTSYGYRLTFSVN